MIDGEGGKSGAGKGRANEERAGDIKGANFVYFRLIMMKGVDS